MSSKGKYIRRPIKPKTCPYCGVTFQPLNAHQIQCGAWACRQAHYKQFKIAYDLKCGKKPLPSKTCPYCGISFQPINGKQICCGAENCKKIQKKEHIQDVRAGRVEAKRYKPTSYVADSPSDGKQRLCRHCGRPIKNGNWYFCRECRNNIDTNPRRLDGDWIYASCDW